MEKKQLTQETVTELSKEYLSKSVQLEYSDNDTDGSTKGSLRSSKQFMDQYPELVKKHENFQKSGFSQSEKKKEKRRSSLTTIPVLEENEKEDNEFTLSESQTPKKKQIPHLRLMKDHQEFSQKMQKIIDERNLSRNEGYRNRTSSVDRLPKVLEEEEQEEIDESKKSKMFENLIDQNEFNSSQMHRRISQKKFSGLINSEVIQEDYDQEKGDDETKKRSIFSLNDLSINNINSPRYKLKVDELDRNRDHRENSFNFTRDLEQIRPIEEEEKEKDQPEQTESQIKFEHSIEKLHKEQQHIRHIGQEGSEHDEDKKVKQEIDSMGQIQEIEDSSDEDNGFNFKEIRYQSKKRSSVQSM